MENLIDGRGLAARIRADVGERVSALESATGTQCGLATILVGDDPGSLIYIANKHRACREAGMASFDIHLDASTSQDELDDRIRSVGADPGVHGMILQVPLPPGLDADRASDLIPPAKDADGLTVASQGLLATLRPGPRPATPAGVIELLRAYDVPLRGADAVIVGRSAIVGKPMAHLLLEQDATVTMCHSKTRDLEAITRRADVLVVAIGRPAMITGPMVREGAVVIDVGMNRTADGVCGDVDFAAVQPRAGRITPVPGGVGPMTIAMLLRNTIDAAERQAALAVAGYALQQRYGEASGTRRDGGTLP